MFLPPLNPWQIKSLSPIGVTVFSVTLDKDHLINKPAHMFTNLTYAPVIDTKNGATPLKGVTHLFAKHHAGYPLESQIWWVKPPGHGMYVWKSLKKKKLRYFPYQLVQNICAVNSNFSATCASKIIVSIQSNFNYKFYIPTFASYVYIATYHCIRLHRLYL